MKTNKKDTEFILPLSSLGGRNNIVKVNNCATRLRLEVKDSNKIDEKEIEKYYPSVLKISPTEVHIVVGTNAGAIAESLEKLLASNIGSLNDLLELITLLGGKENIVKVNNCATRLRLNLKDANKVNAEEIKKYYEFWQQYMGNLSKVSQKVNDTYLKANSQDDGIKSYSRVVKLLVLYHNINPQ